MRLLVDTSVWSLALRVRAGPEPRLVALLRRHVTKGNVVLLGIVLQEVLQGFRLERDFQVAARTLAAFPMLQLDRAHYVAAAELRRDCAAAGIAATTIDCQIASAAIRHRCHLLTRDEDFQHIAHVSDLKMA